MNSYIETLELFTGRLEMSAKQDHLPCDNALVAELIAEIDESFTEKHETLLESKVAYKTKGYCDTPNREWKEP